MRFLLNFAALDSREVACVRLGDILEMRGHEIVLGDMRPVIGRPLRFGNEIFALGNRLLASRAWTAAGVARRAARRRTA